ncbi:hypothetical protein ACJRO7_015830 [Eucalyptus globulus]|uniref:F-box domain-containing protein n=1 Tax=Eucalyptus globulus TaxID=34317 RepID=A0ABD3LF98_EUCGL
MDRDDGRDAISNLPDSVLLHILSFLPPRDAVRTVMVPGFRYLWTSTRHLSFDHRPYHDRKKLETAFEVDDKFVDFTDHVLTLHESPTIDSFRLNLNCASEVDPHDSENEEYVTPVRRRTWTKLDTCSSLVELKLASCVVRPVAGRVQLRSLRRLFMNKIDLTENKMADIPSGSPPLKELSLEDCYGLHEPKFCCGPSIEELNLERCGGLEKLDLTRSDIKHLMIDHYGDLELVCPNVKILDIAGCLDYVKVTDMSSLVDTSLCFSDYKIYPPGEYCEFRLLLEKLSCSTYFMPCDWCILVLTMWELTNHPCPSFAWKHVTLQMHLRKQYVFGICSLLRNSHFLETLTIYVYPERDDNKAKWRSVDGTFPCLEHQLKHVKIYGYVLEPDVNELIEFLFKNAQVLEKMEISIEKTLQQTCSKYMFSSDIGHPSKDYCTSDALLEFSQKFLSFPRASTRAVLHLG